MLHEILLSLSGIPSPVWAQSAGNTPKSLENIQSQLTSSERAILGELAELSQLHVAIKQSLSSIQAQSRSPVCLAVHSEISKEQLGAFRTKVLEVEESILMKDATYVGGYDIVPLSALVTDFAPWHRRLQWLLKVTTYMLQTATSQPRVDCSSASLFDFLESESHTGFYDIEAMAVRLLHVAQETWMRSVASWVLHGQLAVFGHSDFMIQYPPGADPGMSCHLEPSLVPFFVTSSCAENILGVGNSLNQLKQQNGIDGQQPMANATMELLPLHCGMLKSLTFPLHSSRLEAVMEDLNRSVSQNALSQLLPMSKIYEVCQMIQSYLLLERGEFAIALIENMEQRLLERDRSQSNNQPVRKLGRLDSLVISDTELNTVLAKTWTDLSALQSEIESEDRAFIFAKAHLRLSVLSDTSLPDRDQLISTLAPRPTLLHIDIPIESPLNIFVSHVEIAKYAHINAHLLSIRRAQIRLSSLWKMTAHRRCHPTPLGPPASGTEFGKRIMHTRRQRENQRSFRMRRQWSALSKALFFVNELLAYLQGEVIRNSWLHFEIWLSPHRQSSREQSKEDKASAGAAAELVSEPDTQRPELASSRLFMRDVKQSSRTRDPRALAQAHRLYLHSLYSALLIDKEKLSKALTAFLSLIDHIAALLSRLQAVWQGLDLQEDDGIMDVFMNYAKDEQDLLAEMDRSRMRLEQALQDLVQNFRDIEHELGIDNVVVGTANLGIAAAVDGTFLPWRARTLDRLIMKLDFLQTGPDEEGDLFYDAQAGSE